VRGLPRYLTRGRRSYYVNDYRHHFPRVPPPPPPAGPPRGRLREDHGLPAAGPLLCNFNNLYKLSPDVFELWLQVRAATVRVTPDLHVILHRPDLLTQSVSRADSASSPRQPSLIETSLTRIHHYH
jgi:hypothetical protein